MFLLLCDFERLGPARQCPGLFSLVGAVHLRESVVESDALEKLVPRDPVTNEIDGETNWGTSWIAGKIITVSTDVSGKRR